MSVLHGHFGEGGSFIFGGGAEGYKRINGCGTSYNLGRKWSTALAAGRILCV